MKRVDFSELVRRHQQADARTKSKPGWRLKHWRLMNELSQAQAAKRFGCSQPIWSQYELGVKVPHDEYFRVLVRSKTGVRWP